MILKRFSPNCANKLSKMIIPIIQEPFHMQILWLQYEDFNRLSRYFNNKIHNHTFYEVHFILEGTGSIIDAKQKEYAVHAGEAIIVPRDLPHTFQNQNNELKRFSIAFTILGDIVLSDFSGSLTIMTLNDVIIDNLNTVFAHADHNNVLSLYVIRNRIYEILCDLLNLEERSNRLPSPELSHTNVYISKAQKYISDNLNIILTCKDVADYCHINEIYLNRLFKKHTGETLLKYIQGKKITYSIELLKNKDLSVGTISAMLGFPNEYYFNAFFKKAVGLPPGAYRNINITAR